MSQTKQGTARRELDHLAYSGEKFPLSGFDHFEESRKVLVVDTMLRGGSLLKATTAMSLVVFLGCCTMLLYQFSGHRRSIALFERSAESGAAPRVQKAQMENLAMVPNMWAAHGQTAPRLPARRSSQDPLSVRTSKLGLGMSRPHIRFGSIFSFSSL